MPAINFVLSGLDQSVTSLLAAIEKVTPATIKYDATAIQNVTLTNILNTFKFQTDSEDLSDLAATDINYYVDATHMGLASSWNPMSSIVVEVLDTGDNWGRVATYGSDGTTQLSDLSPSADYERHLAEKLFGTHFGVDLFTNEASIKSTLISDVSGSVQTVLNAAATKTNSDTTDANLCRELMMQIFNENKERFADISNTDGIQSLPIEVNDTISFRIVVKAASGQEDVTGLTDITRVSGEAINFDDEDLTTLDKVYRIKFVVVAD